MSKSEQDNSETGKRHRFDVINRRTFLKLSSAFMALLAISHVFKRTVIGEPDPPLVSGESITTETWVPTSCLNCASRCATRVRVVNGKAVNVTGNPLSQVSEGEVCPRAFVGLQVLYDPDRVKGPMKRTNPSKGKGVDPGWEEISWEQALTEVGTRLKKLRDKQQPQRLLMLYGLNSVSDEDIIKRFAQAYGTPNASPAEPYGWEAVKAGNWMADGHYSLHSYDLPSTNYILAFGAGILESEKPLSRNLRMWGKIRRDRPNRARVVVIDPRYSLTASKADRWIPINPGSDGALAMAIANVIINEGLHDADFIDNCTEGFPEYKELVLKDYQPEDMAAITGISVETIREIAREFARTRPAIAWPGHGAAGWPNGTYNSYAIHCLNALVGSIDTPGGVTYQKNPEYRPLPEIEEDDTTAGYLLPRLDRCGTDSFPIAEAAVNQIADSILEENPYPVEMAIGFNENLNMSAPGTWRWQAALAKIPYYVHVAPFLNETAEFADIVLPCPTFMESWGYDHSPPGSGSAELKIKQPVVTPLHETRDIFDIVRNLAREIGGSVAGSFSRIGESARDFLAYRTGNIIPWGEFSRDGVWVGPAYHYRRYDRIFETPSKKFEFYSGNLKAKLKESGIIRDSLTCLPHYEESEFLGNSEEYPLLLSTYQPLPDIENGNQNYPWAQEIYMVMHGQGWTNFIEMNRQTAASLDIEDGDDVIAESPCGTLRGKARVFEGIMPGIISIAAGQGHYAGGRWAEGIGINPNEITGVDYDRLSGQSAFFNTRVRVRRI
jgi:anaerobic selenocysteine-containing dehydrogenase